MSRATYLRALDKCNRISDIGTVCSTCGTAYVADPKKENTETCGLCKIRLAEFMQKLNDKFLVFRALDSSNGRAH